MAIKNIIEMDFNSFCNDVEVALVRLYWQSEYSEEDNSYPDQYTIGERGYKKPDDKKYKRFIKEVSARIADIIGVDERSIYNWYNRKIEPSFENMASLCCLLGLDFRKFIKTRKVSMEEMFGKAFMIDDENIDEIKHLLGFTLMEYTNKRIPSLDEFLNVLPYLKPSALSDFVFRCFGLHNDYVYMTDLWDSLVAGSEKSIYGIYEKIINQRESFHDVCDWNEYVKENYPRQSFERRDRKKHSSITL